MTSSRQARAREPSGKEVCLITPALLGGDPDDPRNRVELDREKHLGYVRFRNRKIVELRRALE